MSAGLCRAVLGVCVTAILGLSGCSGPDVHDCNDGLDNDGDGLTDRDDVGCLANQTAESPDPRACGDGLDNDGDGLIDLDDPGCEDEQDRDESHIVRPVCSDGVDNDGDGLTDYPNDPGCFLPLEGDEVDDCPDGASCPQCANGVDDDSDGLIDYQGVDPGCEAAADFDEFNIDEDACGGLTIRAIPDTNSVMGNVVVGAESMLRSPTCGGDGSESVFVLQMSQPGSLGLSTVDPITTADTVIYIRGDCLDPATELACNDDFSQTATSSEFVVDIDVPGAYYVIVDSANLATFGGFRLEVTYFPVAGSPCGPGLPECSPGHTCRPVDDNTTETACWPPVCSDAHDNDGDGLIDFPFEPGCLSPDDTTEDDDCPSGVQCPSCGNGVDDDFDGVIDYPAEPDCTSASDDDEFGCSNEPNPLVQITGPTTFGSTNGFDDNFTPSCAGTSMAPDAEFLLRVPGTLNSLNVNTIGSSLDTVLSIKTPFCGATDLRCDVGSDISMTNVTAGNYFLIVDGEGSSSGTFNLNVTGEIAAGQPCDLGQINAGLFQCAPGSACDGTLCATPLR